MPKASTRFFLSSFLLKNLEARPVRSGLSVLGIALQVFLVLFVVGLTTGVVHEWGKRVEGVGADLIVQPPNASIFFALSGAVMPESAGEGIRGLEGVAEAAPVLVLLDTKGLDMIYGIDYPRFNALSQGFHFLAGRPFQAPNELLVDDMRAQARNLKVGDTVTLLGHDFTICGIVAHGKGARFFLPLRTAQEMSGAEGRVSLFYVRSAGDTEGARQAITGMLPDHRIRSMDEYLTLMTSENLPELQPFVRSMIGLGVTISFLVVLLTMYTMVLERTREIGILKALGASKLDIGKLVLAETVLMTVVGVVAGVAGTYGIRWLLQATTPTLAVLIPQEWIFRAAALALAGALAGALYPAYRAAGFDPVDALAYE